MNCTDGKTVMFQEAEIDQAYLIVLDTSMKVKEYKVSDHMIIGRYTEKSVCDIKLHSSIVSRNHGEITKINQSYYYKDLKSTNGTYVNEIYLGKDSLGVHKLNYGDVLRIDQNDFENSYEDAVVMILVADTGHSEKWNTVRITEDTSEIRIGRNVSGIHIEDERVSRQHAIFRNDGAWTIEDCNSTNGVFVNNSRIRGKQFIYKFDVIRIADTYIIFTDHALYYRTRVDEDNKLSIHIIERSVWQNLKKHVLLQDINIDINAGEMVLVLGGSGAGKTTFINAVMGYEKAKGKMLHGNHDIYKEYSHMKYEIGFVPQQDLMRDNETVLNVLNNAALMKLPKNISINQRNRRVSEVLELLGLQREEMSLVKKLSGGQRKRLSIAVEYIADPKLFFLDEPDSGLDGIMARNLMQNLRMIADEGKIVIVITHAPDRVSQLFDKVIVLAKSAIDNSGHLAYYGATTDALEFFGVNTLEGIVKRINRPDEGGDGLSDEYIEKYKVMAGEDNE